MNKPFVDYPNNKEIGYAYPSSPTAVRFRKGRKGCFFLKINGAIVETFATLDDAVKRGDAYYSGVWTKDSMQFHPAK